MSVPIGYRMAPDSEVVWMSRLQEKYEEMRDLEKSYRLLLKLYRSHRSNNTHFICAILSS